MDQLFETNEDIGLMQMASASQKGMKLVLFTAKSFDGASEIEAKCKKIGIKNVQIVSGCGYSRTKKIVSSVNDFDEIMAGV